MSQGSTAEQAPKSELPENGLIPEASPNADEEAGTPDALFPASDGRCLPRSALPRFR